MNKYQFVYIDFADNAVDFKSSECYDVRLIGLVERIWQYDEWQYDEMNILA